MGTSAKTFEEPTKIWNMTFISVFITNALLYFGEQMIQTLITSYAKSLGAAEVVIGMVASAFALTAIVFKVISAPAIDTFNRKYILFGAMCVIGISALGFSFSTNITMVFAFRLLQGIGKAFTATCCLALATDALPADKLGEGIGIFSLAQAMCQALGPTIGKFIQGAFGFHITFFISAVCLFIGAGFALNIKTNFVRTKKFRISLDSMFAKEGVLAAVTLFFLSLCFSLINSFMYIFAQDRLMEREYTYIGFYFLIYAGTLLFTRPFVGKMADKYGTVKVVIPSICCFAFSFWFLSFSTKLWMFFAAAFISAFGYGASQPALNALCMKMVPKEKRGAGSCTNYIGVDLGQLLGPTIGGAIAGVFGYANMWRVMTMSMAFALITVITFRKKISQYNN